MKTKLSTKNPVYACQNSFREEGEIKIFSDKQKLREFVSSKAAQQEMLKAIV